MAEYTDAERQMALDIYRTRGATAAANAIGCARQTVYQWLADELSDDTEGQKLKESETRQTVMRSYLRERLLYNAIRLNDRVAEGFTFITKDGNVIELDEVPGFEALKLITASAVALDKYRLERGESTGRTESVTITLGMVEAEIARREAEMGHVADPNP